VREHEPWCEVWQWEPEDRAGVCDCGAGGYVVPVDDLPEIDRSDEVQGRGSIEATAAMKTYVWLLRLAMGWLPANMGLEHPLVTYRALTGQHPTAITFPG